MPGASAADSRSHKPKRNNELERAYAECIGVARSHYENFPVASWLLPRRVRKPIAVIYAFARKADDVADEDGLTPEERFGGLAALETVLDRIESGSAPESALELALNEVVRRHALPLEPFRDLLSAFRQDVVQRRYENFGEVMDYCRRSANPIGRLLLHLLKHADARDLARADALCSALQLVNFYQDLAQDYTENRRIYIPADEMRRCGVGEDHFRFQRSDAAMHQLMHLQYERAQRLLQAGAPLAKRLPGRFGIELRLTVLGAKRVLHKLMQSDNVFARPRLDAADWVRILWDAARGR